MASPTLPSDTLSLEPSSIGDATRQSASTQTLSPSPSLPLSSSTRSHLPASSQSTATTTEAFTSASGGFFSHSGTVVGTFALVCSEIFFVSLMIFLFYRRGRRNPKTQTRAQQLHPAHEGMRKNPFADDYFEPRNPRDFPSSIGCHHKQGGTPFHSAVGHNVFDHTENGYAARELTKQRIYDHYQDDLLDLQVSRPISSPPPYDKQFTFANHPFAMSPSRAYTQFPSWRRLSQTPSSPSIYPATLPATEDDISAYGLSIPANTACLSPQTGAASDQNYYCEENATKPSARGLPDNPTIYTRTPIESENGQGCTPVFLVKPPSHRESTSYPPPIPPKSPLRRVVSARNMFG